MEVILEARALTKRFGVVTALDQVDCSIKAGEFVAIMGPSGSGKTTLLNIFACLEAPSEGQYALDGLNTSTMTEHERTIVRRENVGLIFQQFHLIPYLSAVENVMLAQHYHSLADRHEAQEALAKVGLADRADHRPSQLSGGEQQRVCIARALINQPPVVLADEPTGNLDAANETIVIGLLRRLNEEGTTVIIVTHNAEIGRQAARIVRLNHGRIEPTEDGPGWKIGASRAGHDRVGGR